MAVLAGLRVVQIGPGLGAAVCGRLFADVDALVTCVDAQDQTRLRRHLDAGKAKVANEIARSEAVAGADLIVCEGGPRELERQGIDPASIRRINRSTVLVLISPYGQIGPQADDPATDLTLLFASGIARMLTGQVDDLSEAPIRPVGQQSAFIGGIAAACAGMHAVMSPAPGAVVDVSIQEALATIAITELAQRRRSAGRAGRAGGSPTATAPQCASCRRATAMPRSRRAMTINGKLGWRSWDRRSGGGSRASRPSAIASPIGTRSMR